MLAAVCIVVDELGDVRDVNAEELEFRSIDRPPKLRDVL